MSFLAMKSRKCRLDSLSQDMLDKDFVKVFQPIHFLSRILGLLRIDIRDKFVTPPSPGYQIYTAIVRVIDLLTAIQYIVNCETIFNGTLTDLFLKAGMVGVKIGNAAVSWRNVFLYGRANSQLFVKLQKMDRGLIPSKIYLNKKLSKITLNMTVFAAGLGAINVISYMVLIPTAHCSMLGLTVNLILSLGLYTDVVLSIITVYYIGIRVEYLNTVLGKEAGRFEHKSKLFKAIWLVGGSRCAVKYSDQTVNSLYSILDVMADWLRLYQYPIFNFIVLVFGTDLIVVQSFVTSLKEQVNAINFFDFKTGDYRSTLYLCPLFLFTAVHVVLCLLAASVSSKVETTRKLCNHIAYTRPNGKSRDFAKRMMILLNAKRDMNVYNIFTLNSSLPVNLLGAVALYAIVLFQFALL